MNFDAQVLVVEKGIKQAKIGDRYVVADFDPQFGISKDQIELVRCDYLGLFRVFVGQV